MLDRSLIGHEFTPFTAEVERGRLKFFAKAIGETNPVYTDLAAAREAGYRDLPAPPTFPFVLDMDAPEFLPVLGLFDLDIARILHGAQEFEYFTPICAGDVITIKARVADVFDKKNGALEFVVIESTYTNQIGELTARSTNTVVHHSGKE